MTEFTPADIIAFIWFLICSVGYSVVTRVGPWSETGIVKAVSDERARWMQIMARREMRMVDTQILDNLARGNAFFASTALLVLGGLTALFGAAGAAQDMLSHIPFLHRTTEFVWQLKVMLLMAIYIFAFFKFAWAFRLSHYTAILVGATPRADDDDEAECARYAQRAARLAGLAGEHANAGLRAYYFGLAAFAWILHPVALIVAATWVVLVLYRREYQSRALRTMAGE